ncbi:MAG: undecaprenyl/decaprenyl-phosphate alpha-N-acetylglucosaminyl 1-phosphate transferase [Victivallales bacterium]|nr:undecaprenyl/decaprenyl-phosphate alpha-N-acetylglucosaminyl 1-phosphate transferase [Victivallales bacterium]MCF7889474.1 undecaprenyl/decaprenyl-phosphate alpha-N-acetylglucosaminyl 1-phosphate transferase [Victivallales bacterium]
MTWWNIYVITIAFSAMLGLILTPIFRKLALLLDVVDKPAIQDHKAHKNVTPLFGGLSMCATWLITLMIGSYTPDFLAFHDFSPQIVNNLAGVFEVRPRLIAIIIGAVLITALGLIDDKTNLSAKVKFAGQLVISMFAVYYGNFRISIFILNPVLSFIVTVMWLLMIINAINFFDNMDGLAVGVAAIAFAFFAITGIIHNNYFVACLNAASLGTAIGFWFYNHSPATIFMGDSGSHFLGYTLGISGAMTTYYKSPLAASPLAILIPVFILSIPLFDFFSVIIIRMTIKEPVYIGDNNHLSHRFCKLGMTRKNAVFLIHLLSVIIGLSVIPLLWGDFFTGLICFIQACLILLLISVIQLTVIRRDKE